MAASDLLSALNGGNASFMEQVLAQYKKAPDSIDPSWRELFDGLKDEVATKPSWARKDWPQLVNGELVAALDGNWGATETAKAPRQAAETGGGRAATLDSIRAIMLIRAFRIRGHLMANLDPLGLTPPRHHPELDPASYGFGPGDMDRMIFIDNVLGLEQATLREIVDLLKRTYASTIGVEFMHISEPEEKAWILGQLLVGRGPKRSVTVSVGQDAPEVAAPSLG